MPILPVIIDDMLISAFERINGRRNITGINHPELNILRREMAARQGRYFVLMRQAVNEIAHEIGKEHKIELRFHIRKYQWGELASAMETLKRLAPGNDTVPDGCSRAISRMQQLAYGR